MLAGKKILLGITGGISVYKMCTVVRLFKKAGADVRVMMTASATQFVTPLTFSTLSQEEVLVSLWPSDASSATSLGVKHIEYGLWADLMLIAPATANTIAHIAHGYAEDIISTTVLALRAPLVIAPAMDVDMWENDATQKNVSLLRGRGYFILPPGSGELASGLVGAGRLPEPETIAGYVDDVLEKAHLDLRGKKILVTAGPTHEPIDPVRFIGNRSSGKMGFALASAASLRGASVTLISGPVALETPKHVNRIDVETAEEMFAAVTAHAKKNDVIIMSAAVADYTPKHVAKEKIKKNSTAAQGMTLELRTTTDIIKTLGEKKSKKQILIGFALETQHEVANAKEKLKKKKLDLIVLNSARNNDAAFGKDTNVVTIIDAKGTTTPLPKMTKFDTANAILDFLTKKN
jgi:phosphopantothenoylcysteine decarboxylase/phosphopantothenate--cysteine ligase